MADKIALQPLEIGYARAFNRGDVVPEAHVKAHDWSDLVASVGSKAANEAQGIAADESAGLSGQTSVSGKTGAASA